MKKTYVTKKVLQAYWLFLIITTNVWAQVGIGTTSPVAALDINSTNEGLLVTRVALTGTDDITTIATRTASELVYNTAIAGSGNTAVTPGYYYLNTAASGWIRLATKADTLQSWNLTGNSGTDPTINFIGTTDNQGFSIRTFGSEKIRVTSGGNLGIGTTTPDTRLTVNGTTKTDGFILTALPIDGAVLTSNSGGVGTWTVPVINNVVATLNSGGINIPYNTTQYRQTNSSITLPPGKYTVNISMLLRIINVGITPPNSSFWLRSSFSDSALDNNPVFI
ncbi:MAG TPA: hypothetical protein VF677_04130 [Flavobacterium sp.]|jgi:hypothetical protein